jgi:lysozyme
MPSTRDEAIALAATITPRFEGCRLTAYPDTEGVPTIGYGHTGPEVRLGQEISQAIADHDLDVDLGHAADEVERVCNLAALAGLDSHERATLYDFAFNCGADPKWTIWADVDHNPSAVPAQLLRFVNGKVNGVESEIPGLEHRRQAEIIYWNTADVEAAVAVTQTANAVQAPSSGYTRSIVTPPTPITAPPLAQVSLVAKVVTVGGGLVAAVGSNAQQIHDIIAPAAEAAPIFQTAATIAIGVVVVCGVVGLFIHEAQAQARKT